MNTVASGDTPYDIHIRVYFYRTKFSQEIIITTVKYSRVKSPHLHIQGLQISLLM